MVVLLRFRSARFDSAGEPPNPINPIRGHAALVWAGAVLRAEGFGCSAPQPEDWGWYSDVVDPDGGRYLVGASGDATGGGDTEWCLQLHARRGVWDRLRGANPLTLDAPLVQILEGRLRAEPEVDGVEREVER